MIALADIQEIVDEINFKEKIKPTVKEDSLIGEELGIDSLDTQTFWFSLMFLMDKRGMKEFADEYMLAFDYSVVTVGKLLEDLNHDN
jgi:acyl carrier protein